MPLIEEIAKLGFAESCIICSRKFTKDDISEGDVEVIPEEPLFTIGRFVKVGEGTELRLFHKGTAYHASCYYNRKYRLDK